MSTATVDRNDVRAAWLAERKTGIGSSDAAAVLGMNPYRTALEVYLEKCGLSDDIEDNEAMEVGREIEPVLRSLYEKRTGMTLQGPPPLMRHSQHAFMLANLDDMREDGRIVELKNVGLRMAGLWGDEGTDDIPELYICQVQHQMAVAGCDSADVVALIGGQNLKIFTVSRNDRFIDRMIEIEAEFWGRVTSLNPPEPDWNHPQVLRAVESLIGDPGSEAIVLPDSMREVIEQFREAKGRKKEAESDEKRLKAQIEFAMGGAGRATLGSYTITRKMVHKEPYSVGAQDYAQLTVKAQKGE